MAKTTLMAGVSRFAHFAGLARAAADDSTPTDDKEKDGKKGKGAEGDETTPADDKDGKKGKGGAETVDPEDQATEDDDDPDAEDDKDEMSGKSAAARGRRRERARCAAIFAHPSAAANVALAASFAFESTMTRHEAIAALKSAARVGSSAARAAANPRLGPGGAAPSGKTDHSASWDRAFSKAGFKPAKA